MPTTTTTRCTDTPHRRRKKAEPENNKRAIEAFHEVISKSLTTLSCWISADQCIGLPLEPLDSATVGELMDIFCRQDAGVYISFSYRVTSHLNGNSRSAAPYSVVHCTPSNFNVHANGYIECFADSMLQRWTCDRTICDSSRRVIGYELGPYAQVLLHCSRYGQPLGWILQI
jgi:hypothetical protein